MCVSYNLRGLRLIVIGTVLMMIFSVIESAVSAVDEEASFFILPLELAASVVTIVGIFKCSYINERFRQAKVYTLVTIGLCAAALAVCLICVVNLLWDDESESLDSAFFGGLIGLVAVILLLLAALVMSCICVYELLYGCRDIALAEEDQELARKCQSIWSMYIWSTVGSLLFFIIGVGTSQVSEIAGLVFLAIFGIGALMVLAAEIRSLLCFWRTWKTYDGKPVAGQRASLPQEPTLEHKEP